MSFLPNVLQEEKEFWLEALCDGFRSYVLWVKKVCPDLARPESRRLTRVVMAVDSNGFDLNQRGNEVLLLILFSEQVRFQEIRDRAFEMLTGEWP
ncbi:MAG TPA: hypothetical protein PKA63_07435 [Oligoflexia bacterium]|nr:hypothetical protein [Oligoflexia bacterium]HMP48482.1 hypothetical protein [Oligoflexia bacterium]